MTWTEADFYEVWIFIWNFGDIATILNIYGTSAGFVPPTSVADTARFNDIAGMRTNNFPEVG